MQRSTNHAFSSRLHFHVHPLPPQPLPPSTPLLSFHPSPFSPPLPPLHHPPLPSTPLPSPLPLLLPHHPPHLLSSVPPSQSCLPTSPILHHPSPHPSSSLSSPPQSRIRFSSLRFLLPRRFSRFRESCPCLPCPPGPFLPHPDPTPISPPFHLPPPLRSSSPLTSSPLYPPSG